MPTADAELLQREADALGMSVSELAAELIAAGLKRRRSAA